MLYTITFDPHRPLVAAHLSADYDMVLHLDAFIDDLWENVQAATRDLSPEYEAVIIYDLGDVSLTFSDLRYGITRSFGKPPPPEIGPYRIIHNIVVVKSDFGVRLFQAGTQLIHLFGGRIYIYRSMEAAENKAHNILS